MCVKEILDGIIVCGGRNDHEISIFIGCRSVECRRQVKIFFRQILFDVLVLNGRQAAVDFLHLFGNHVDSRDMIVLRQKSGDTKPDISGAGNSYVISLFHHHSL